MASMSRVAPRDEFRGAPLEFTTDALLIHLDDTESEIQEAVLGALQAFALIDAAYVRRKAVEARDRHRTAVYIDALLRTVEGSTS